MKQGAMKSFFGNVFVRMNEGRLTPELMYTPASAFLQFFPLPKFNIGPKNDGFQVQNLLFQGAIVRFHVKLWVQEISNGRTH